MRPGSPGKGKQPQKKIKNRVIGAKPAIAGVRTRTIEDVPVRKLLIAYGAWMVLLSVAYYAAAAVRPYAWTAIGLTSAAAVAYGARRLGPHRTRPWHLLAGALILFTAGGSVFLFTADRQVFPALDELLIAGMYVLLVISLLSLPRASTRSDWGGVADVLVVTASLGLLAWVLIIHSYLAVERLAFHDVAIGVGFPLLNVVVAAALARFVQVAPGRPAVGLLASGVIALLVASGFFVRTQLRTGWHPGGPVDIGWLLFFAACGAAALHPSMRAITEPAHRPDRPITLARLLALGVSALIPPAILLVESIRRIQIDAEAISALTTLVFIVVLLRLAGVVGLYRQASQREAGLRESVSTLVTTTDVESVRSQVGAAVARLFPNGEFAMALSLAGDAPIDEAVSGDPGGPRFLPTAAIGSPELAHLHAYDVALIAPLDIPGRADPRPPVGTLIVAADQRRLLDLRDSLASLAALAARTVERIQLTGEIARRNSEQYFRALVQTMVDVVIILDDDGSIRYASPSAATVLGEQDIVGRNVTELPVEAQRDRAREALRRIQAGEDPPGMGLWTARRPDGEIVDVHVVFRDLRDEPTVRGIVLTLTDVTDRTRLERELRHLAFHDALTDLPNRVEFTERVRTAIAAAADRHTLVGVLFLDVDDFKLVNDTMGHEIGDRLLQIVAERLKQILRPGDTAARLGGDEFAILIEGETEMSHVEDAAARVVDALATPVELEGAELAATASIGVATSIDADTESQLLRSADLALYVAKGAGKGQWRRYEPALHEEMMRRRGLRERLDRALRHDEFRVVYQPIVQMATNNPVGFEALLRWDDPERGPVPPQEFIGVAEESGLIVPIGELVLRRAADSAMEWGTGPEDPYVSVNISVRQFHSPGFLDVVWDVLSDSGLSPRRLVIEITETLLLAPEAHVWTDLATLREAGIRVAIDDFGTGYSSLSYLRQVAIDVLKIDRSFIDPMATSVQQRALVDTIVQLAKQVGLDVVAEGVERGADRDLLVTMGCPLGQGFLFGKPMEGPEAVQWLNDSSAGARTVGR
jgi:diguanylate cyclase (GGDEF)-like protein/PAS domain S-box-containing protein